MDQYRGHTRKTTMGIYHVDYLERKECEDFSTTCKGASGVMDDCISTRRNQHNVKTIGVI
jgi:hypothetical protein